MKTYCWERALCLADWPALVFIWQPQSLVSQKVNSKSSLNSAHNPSWKLKPKCRNLSTRGCTLSRYSRSVPRNLFCTLMHLFWSDVFKLQVWKIVEEVEGCDLGGHGWSVKTSRYTKASLNSRRRWENAQNPRSSVISGNCYSHLGFPFPSTHSWISHQLTVGFVIVIQLPGTIDDLFCLSCVCKLVLELGKMFFEVFRIDLEMLSFLNSLWKVSLVVGFFFGGSSHKVHNKFSSC